MHVPFERQPLQIVSSLAEAALLVQDMHEVGLPAFILNCAGIPRQDVEAEVIQMTTGAGLSNGGYYLERRQKATDDEMLQMYAPPYRAPGDVRAEFQLWRTLSGKAESSFFVPAKDRPVHSWELPARTHQLFCEGMVDDAVLKPSCYTGELKRDHVLFFRSLPQLACYFKVTSRRKHVLKTSRLWPARQT